MVPEFAASGAGHCPAQNSGTRIYGSRIRVRTGGSKWQSALPTGSNRQSAPPTGSKWNRALPGSKWVQV